MTKDEMLGVLKNSFKDFKFYEDGHYYECKGEKVGISVTRLIEEYTNEFNQQEIAEKCAVKENRSVEDILAEWKYKADFACAKGTTCHEFAQTLWSKQKCNLLSFDDSDNYWFAVSTIQKQAIHFWQDYREHLEHLQDELVVGSEEYDIASAIDHLFYNKLTGGLVLVDYKTNSILKGYNDSEYNRKYTKKMKVPLHNIEDDALHHYYIQLSIYKYLVEKYSGLKVNEMFIVSIFIKLKIFETIF